MRSGRPSQRSISHSFIPIEMNPGNFVESTCARRISATAAGCEGWGKGSASIVSMRILPRFGYGHCANTHDISGYFIIQFSTSPAPRAKTHFKLLHKTHDWG